MDLSIAAADPAGALAMEIRLDSLERPEVINLLEEHLACMARISPPGSCHVMNVARLRGPDVTFWSLWDGGRLAGCGALKEIDPTHGEVKSMRTARPYLRQGVARRLLLHILTEARRRRYRRLSLETGSMPYFEPARNLYRQAGFLECEPFAEYRPDPNSVFFTREI